MSARSLPVVTCPDDWPRSVDLGGRVILLLGASGGLGQCFARAAARAGAELVLVGRRVAALERLYDDVEALGGRAALYPLNLGGANPDDYATLAERIGGEFGRLAAIVFASAHMRGLSMAEHTSPEDWLGALHINLGAPFLLVQACLPLLRKSEDSAIVFAIQGPERCARAYWGGYGVAQAGLAQLVAILGDELESTSVRVHGFDPGAMRTGLRQRIWFSEDPSAVPTPERAADVLTGLVGQGGRGYRGKLLRLPAPG